MTGTQHRLTLRSAQAHGSLLWQGACACGEVFPASPYRADVEDAYELHRADTDDVTTD